jgi:DNA primase large subunit
MLYNPLMRISLCSLFLAHASTAQGLSMEDALRFWESQFSKIIGHDQFTKQYAYSFRHMYGKEGARKAYTPYSCMKIIMGAAPEPGAHHGCPYRHASDTQLAAMVGGLQLDARAVSLAP